MTHTSREKSIHTVVQHFELASRRSLSMIAWSTLFDAENVFRFLPVGVPRSMEENVPQKNHFRLLSDNKQRGSKLRCPESNNKQSGSKLRCPTISKLRCPESIPVPPESARTQETITS